ncbi:MAG: NAD(P)-dependent oxidoreductase [Pirellulales bacterium]
MTSQANASTTVGFIGLGTMGRPMAHNLLKAGFPLVFSARRDDVAAEMTAAGATRADTPADVTAAASHVVTIVTADAQVREVALGPAGIIESAAAGKYLIDMSTVSPETSRALGAALAPHGMAVIDAPVSGGPWGAESATLTIMCGGDAADFAACRPVLDALGKNIHHLGPLGAGQTVKLVNQLLGAGIMALIGEGMTLARAAGVDLDELISVVETSSGGSTLFSARARKFVYEGHYQPGFMTRLLQKDLTLALDIARGLGVPTPLASAAWQQYAEAINAGYADEDFASVAKICARAAGLEE